MKCNSNCNLKLYGKGIVKGVGPKNAKIMIIGHNPKFTDDCIRSPLAGFDELVKSECGVCSNVRKCFEYWLTGKPCEYDPTLCDCKALSSANRDELIKSCNGDYDRQKTFNTGGQFINRQLKTYGFKREDCYITYVVKCATPGGRPPTIDEVNICKEELLDEIYTVNPEVIIAMGDKVSFALLSEMHKKKDEIKSESIELNGVAYRVFHTYCPEQLLLSNQLAIKNKGTSMHEHYHKIMRGMSDHIKNSVEQAIACVNKNTEPAIYFCSTRDKYGCFSNFSAHGFELDSKYWPTSEHYFQAQKFYGIEYAEQIRNASTPKMAAEMGRNRNVPLRLDWESVKDDIMRKAVMTKFKTHADIKDILLSTGKKELIEKTTHDSYWGCGTNGLGKNMLGKILMEVREKIK